MRSVELFTGAGGLALGLSRAGFSHLALVERDEDSCRTLAENIRRKVQGIQHWPVHHRDVCRFDYRFLPEDIELLAAGVPCQPFSIGGKHRGPQDERNMFPELNRAVRHLKPKAILLENVRGLVRPSFSKYFGYIELTLMYPELQRKSGEEWHEHLSRLERYHTKGKPTGLWYRVIHRVLNAADYGVPQRRERLFMVAVRADLGVEWSFPTATHCQEALHWQQFYTGEYWERHRIPSKQRPGAPGEAKRYPQKSFLSTLLKPWRTVREAVSNLPRPAASRGKDEPGLTHFIIPGARSYVGHTGSPLDAPAKTLKAGVHGVPGGENTLRQGDGSIRYFTIRESARLQTFPDDFIFAGSWTESMRQIGNAVPVLLGEVIARKLKATLSEKADKSNGGRPI